MYLHKTDNWARIPREGEGSQSSRIQACPWLHVLSPMHVVDDVEQSYVSVRRGAASDVLAYLVCT